MNRFVRVLFLAILTLWSLNTQAQSAKLRAANRQFENFSYVSAIRGYEDFLRADTNARPPL